MCVCVCVECLKIDATHYYDNNLLLSKPTGVHLEHVL